MTDEIKSKQSHYDKRINYCSKKINQVLQTRPDLQEFICEFNKKNKMTGFILCNDPKLYEIKNAMPNECKCMFITRACLNKNFIYKPSDMPCCWPTTVPDTGHNTVPNTKKNDKLNTDPPYISPV